MKAAISRWLMHCGLVVAGVFVALILCESLLRILGVTYPVFDDFDDARGVRLRPGKEGWYRAEGEAYLSINSLGYRDREHDRPKPPNTVRIAVLGDSFVEARQVPLQDTFWARLGHELQACDAFDGRSVEVLSFGVGGYNTSQEYLTLKQDVLNFAPDIVLLAIFPGNDIAANSKELQKGSAWRIAAPTHSLIDERLVINNSFDHSWRRQLLYNLIHHLRLVELLNEARRGLRARSWQSTPYDEIEVGLSTNVYRRAELPKWREAWLITEALLAEMNGVVRNAGARFIVVTIPSATQVDPVKRHREEIEERIGVNNLLYPDERILEMGAKAGFEVYAPTKYLQEIAEKSGIYLHGFSNTRPGIGHLNVEGHALLADVIGGDLCDSTTPQHLVTDERQAGALE